MLATRRWAPRNGQAHLYVQNIAEAGRILAARVWIGANDGRVHVDGLDARSVTAEEITRAVRDAQVA